MTGRARDPVLRLARWEVLLAVLAVVVVSVSALSVPGFATGFTLSTSVAAMAEKSLMVLPLALLIIAREIDISVASVAGLSAVVLGLALQSGAPLLVAVAAALASGALCGLLNGALVAFLGLPSLIVTLGTLALFRGLCYVLVGGTPITELPPSLIDFGNADVPRSYLPWVIVPFLVLAPIFWLVLHRTATGRRIYAIGGSPEVAEYSGVPVRRIRLWLFVTSGAVSAVAGVLIVGRTSQASPDAALGFELDAITVVFLGGISVLGGRGRLDGVLLGLLLVITLRAVLQLENVSGYAQGVAVGVLLLASLLLSNLVASLLNRVSGRRHRTRDTVAPPALGSP